MRPEPWRCSNFGVASGVEKRLDAGTLRVEVCESTFYNVKVAELEAWLKRTGGAPKDIIARQKLRTKLGNQTVK